MRKPSRRVSALTASLLTVAGLAGVGAAAASADSATVPNAAPQVTCSFVDGQGTTAPVGRAARSGFTCSYGGFSRFVYGAVYTEVYTQAPSANPSTSASTRPAQYVVSRSGSGSFFVPSASPYHFFGSYVDKVTVTNVVSRNATESATWYLRDECGDLVRC